MGAKKGKIDMSIKRFTLVDFDGLEVDLTNIKEFELIVLLNNIYKEQIKTNELLRKIYNQE